MLERESHLPRFGRDFDHLYHLDHISSVPNAKIKPLFLQHSEYLQKMRPIESTKSRERKIREGYHVNQSFDHP